MQQIPNHIITMAPPRVIHVTITEEDRQKAGSFCENGSCILATALHRMGYRDINEGVCCCFIGTERVEYSHPQWRAGDACATTFMGEVKPKPHYRPEVVGKQIVLTRHDSTP